MIWSIYELNLSYFVNAGVHRPYNSKTKKAWRLFDSCWLSLRGIVSIAFSEQVRVNLKMLALHLHYLHVILLATDDR